MKSAILHQLLQPWNFDRSRWAVFFAQLWLDLMHNERPAQDYCGSPLPVLRMEGEWAIIPISGAITVNLPQWAKAGLPLTDAYDIEEELNIASASDASAIVLDIDSPGGLSSAGEMLHDVVASVARKKPVFAYSRGLLCSAAYQLAAPAVAIHSSRMAQIGSIGTICVLLDDSEWMAKIGLKREIFKSGDYKSMGLAPLTDEEREFMQGRTDAHGETFRSQVKRYRSSIADDDMQGQWFYAKAAAEKGFIHGITPNLSAALARFKRLL